MRKVNLISTFQDGFYKVDHNYVVNTAKLAKDGGCKQFHLVSSTGANRNSSFLYPRTKVILSILIKKNSRIRIYWLEFVEFIELLKGTSFELFNNIT